MSQLKELVKEAFELNVRMRWLKTINKAVKKRDNTLEKFKRQNYVVTKLVEEYKKIYPNDLTGGRYDGRE